MPKLVLARGDISPTDELVIVLSEPDNEPAAVLIHWPPAASVASPTAFPTRPARSPRSSPGPPYGSHNTKHGGCRHWKINPWCPEPARCCRDSGVLLPDPGVAQLLGPLQLAFVPGHLRLGALGR